MSNEIAGVPIKKEDFDNSLNLDIIDGLKFLFRSRLKIFFGMIITLLAAIYYDKMYPVPYISSFQVIPIENMENVQTAYIPLLEKYQFFLDKKLFLEDIEKIVNSVPNHFKAGKFSVQIKFDDEMTFHLITRFPRKIENSEFGQIVSAFNEGIKKSNFLMLEKLNRAQELNKKIEKENYEITEKVYSKFFEIQEKYNLANDQDYIKKMGLFNPRGVEEYRVILLEYLLAKKIINKNTYQEYLTYFLNVPNYSLILNRNISNINKLKNELIPLVSLGKIENINRLEDENRTLKIIFIGLFLGFIFSAILCFGFDWFKKNNKKMFKLF